jgi:hypothetical protein
VAERDIPVFLQLAQEPMNSVLGVVSEQLEHFVVTRQAVLLLEESFQSPRLFFDVRDSRHIRSPFLVRDGFSE